MGVCCGSYSDAKRDVFDLNCVYVVEVTSCSFRRYYLMVLSHFVDDEDEMKPVLCGENARRVMRSYDRQGYVSSVKSASCCLRDDISKEYDKALDGGNYDFCASVLFDLSLELNSKYGYEKQDVKVYVIGNGRKERRSRRV